MIGASNGWRVGILTCDPNSLLMLHSSTCVGEPIQNLQRHLIGLLLHYLLNDFLFFGTQRLQFIGVAIQFPLEIPRNQSLQEYYSEKELSSLIL